MNYRFNDIRISDCYIEAEKGTISKLRTGHRSISGRAEQVKQDPVRRRKIMDEVLREECIREEERNGTIAKFVLEFRQRKWTDREISGMLMDLYPGCDEMIQKIINNTEAYAENTWTPMREIERVARLSEEEQDEIYSMLHWERFRQIRENERLEAIRQEGIKEGQELALRERIAKIIREMKDRSETDEEIFEILADLYPEHDEMIKKMIESQ